jgi:type II secretory ATPase GspE/PulE/Tfp pilus assembly ATPase PilB-like protein
VSRLKIRPSSISPSAGSQGRRIKLRVQGGRGRVRVSVLPTLFGEKSCEDPGQMNRSWT